MSTDEGSTSEQPAPTPTLNNLLRKQGPGSETAGQEAVQNGTGQPSSSAPASEQPGVVPLQPHQQQHPGFPSHYPPHFMQGRPGFPGYPGFPHPGQPYPYPPHMMRPPGAPPMPSQGDLVRLPPGPNPLEWSAQQKKIAESQNNPGTPASVPAPSPAASSVAEDSTDDKSRLDSPSWPQRNSGPPGMVPGGGPQGMMMHPGMMQAPGPMMPRKESIVDKLVGPPTAANPPRVMPERRAFFDRLVAFCEQQGDPITMIPQVSKQNVDLHRLYIAVRNKGGFEQVTKEKMWKSICVEANPEISESSAAGYQLRKHYQRHLLLLECMETGKNADDAVAFADKLKRQRKKEGPAQTPAKSSFDRSFNISNPGYSENAGSSAAGVPSTSQGARFVAATATWYPQQYQQQGNSGYLSRPDASPQMYSSPQGYSPMVYRPPKMSPQPPSYNHYASNYYHQQQQNMQKEAYYRSRGLPPQTDWRGAYGTPGQPAVPSTSGFPPGNGPPGPDPSQFPPPPPQQQQPYPYGVFPGHPGYPPGAFPRIPPGATPMRAPQPQQHIPGAGGEEGQNTLQVPGQMVQPGTPGSHNGPSSVQPSTPQPQQSDSANSQAGSRAPSVGPNVGASTPDSSSRMSAGGEGTDQRPESAAAPTPRSLATPTPGPTPGPPPQQMPPGHPMQMQPSTSMAAQVQPGQPGAPPVPAYYGQPAPMYPNGAARHPGPPGYPPGYPPQGYPPHPGAPMPGMPGVPPQNFPPHPAANPNHPHHQQYLMWQRGYPHQQPGQPPRQMPPQPYGYPPRIQPPQTQMPQGAPSPGGSKMRQYPPSAPHQQQQQPQQFPSQQRPMPPQQQTPVQYQQQSAQPQPPPQMPPSTSSVPFAHGHSFPKSTVEATIISQARRKRPFARDLVNATPRRLVMSLRSGLETEAIWAMNALNVLLYDDSNPHPTLNQMPGLLNVLIEHFWATLSVLFPEEFPISGTSSRESDFSNCDSALSLTKSEDRIELQPIVTARSAEKKNNFTRFSRTGRKVQLKETEMPETLKRQIMGEQGTSQDETMTCEYVDSRTKVGLGGGLAERVAERLRSEWEFSKAEKKPVFSRHEGVSIWNDQEIPEAPRVKEDTMEEDEVPDIFIHRKARESELSDGPNDFEVRWPQPTALTDKDEVLYRLAMRALSLANIIRGFSFLPGNESQLCKHHGLIFLLGRFLRLLGKEEPLLRTKPAPKQDLEAPLPAPEPFHVARKKAVSLLDSDDATHLLMVETANQLRDDAFVILCHLSAHLDLYDMPSNLSFPIYDGILGWCVSSVPEAVDPIPPAATSLRNYCLEIICKMSVLEKNMDMILSTGVWPRMEKFVKLLAKMLSMGEETHNREFAIVILNALCSASEPVCYVTALESPAITHLIAFIESSDQNMHQVMSTHGMTTLRDNPELMGTSVGMLRRAACMLKQLVKVPNAHRVFLKHQQRLLQFTMSQLMDSRVAGMIADTLFEIQAAALAQNDVKIEEPSEIKNEDNDDTVVKREVEDVSPVSSESSSSCENTLSSTGEKSKCNGNPTPRKGAKRTNSGDVSPPSKRNCLENGFSEKKNGKIEKSSLQLKESRSENNSSMAVVA